MSDPNTSTEQPFSIKFITQQETDRVVEFLGLQFFSDEPLNHALDRERNEKLVFPDRGRVFTNSVAEGLSLMAVAPSNEIVGVAINKATQANTENKTDETNIHPNSIKIRRLMHIFEEQAADFVKLRNASEKEMFVWVISVHSAWRNKGVGYALLERSKEIAKENGFNQVRAICSSEYSARLFEKLGFHCVHAIRYEDYKENEEVIFKTDPPHFHMKAMILRFELDNKKLVTYLC